MPGTLCQEDSMAADGNLLKGEVTENPVTEEQEVERLLKGLLRAMLAEQDTHSKTEHQA
jgi:hypothetical protein